MISLGARKIQRIRFISSKGEEDKVMKWCKRTGYVLVDSGPVHNILLKMARLGRTSKRRLKTPDPLGLVKRHDVIYCGAAIQIA